MTVDFSGLGGVGFRAGEGGEAGNGHAKRMRKGVGNEAVAGGDE